MTALAGTVQTLNERSKASCMVYCAVSVPVPNGWGNMIKLEREGKEKEDEREAKERECS